MKKVKPEDIYQYYFSEDFKPELPDNIGFRHFRFKLADKGWRKVPEKIYTKDDLIKWIAKLGGCDLYYGFTTWMNPHKISTKGGSGTYVIADNLVMGSDLVFDIDAEEPITLKTLDVARKSAWNIYLTLKDQEDRYELEYCAFTGYKGFRLAYKDKTLQLPANARERIPYVDQNRKIFIEDLLKKLQENSSRQQFYKIETVFDQKITENIMCVVRVIGSVHSTTGFISSKIPVSMLRRSTQEILNHIPYIGKERPVIPKREMKQDDDDESSPRPRLSTLADDVTGLASLPHPLTHKYFFTNRVLGVQKGFVPIFIYQDNQTYYKREVERLQKEHKLGPLYVFSVDDKHVVISLKAMQRRQLQKVLNKSSSKTKYDFLKYKRVLAPFLMKFEEKIPSGYTGHLSQGHFHYVEPLQEDHASRFCGWAKIEMVRANVENQNMKKKVQKNG